MRYVAFWLLVCLASAAVVVLGAVFLGLALLVTPIALFAGYLLARPGQKRAEAGPSVYEGEFRVLEETPVTPAESSRP